MLSRNMIPNSFPGRDPPTINKKISSTLISSDACPNCGNTRPVFQHVQNGLIVCFICRKATFSDRTSISAS